MEFSLLKAYVLATVEETKQSWAGEDDYQITKPSLIVEVKFELLDDFRVFFFSFPF